MCNRWQTTGLETQNGLTVQLRQLNLRIWLMNVLNKWQSTSLETQIGLTVQLRWLDTQISYENLNGRLGIIYQVANPLQSYPFMFSTYNYMASGFPHYYMNLLCQYIQSDRICSMVFELGLHSLFRHYGLFCSKRRKCWNGIAKRSNI